MFFGGNHGGRIWLSRFGCASVSGGAKTAAYSNGALHTGFSADIRRGKIAVSGRGAPVRTEFSPEAEVCAAVAEFSRVCKNFKVSTVEIQEYVRANKFWKVEGSYTPSESD